MNRTTASRFFPLISILGTVLLFGCRQAPWEKLSPEYTSDTAPQVHKFSNLPGALSSFWTSDGKRLWAVGVTGKILESEDGEHWNARNSGTTKELNSIFGTSDGKRLWAVGDEGTILESENGEDWNARNSGTTNNLYSISGTSNGKRLWAVGDGGTILESGDGERWNARNSGTTNNLYSIFCASDGKRLWAVGRFGTILDSEDGEHWNGLKTVVTLQTLHSIFGTSEGKRLWAVGSAGTILESTDGEDWNARISGTTNHLYFISGTSDGTRLLVVGAAGTILESTDGEHWNPGDSGTTNSLFSIFGAGGKRWWVVGGYETILESEDGEHWNLRNSRPANNLHSIIGTGGGKRLWAVGDGGAIMDSTDGEHWNVRKIGRFSLNCIFSPGEGTRLWAVGDGGTILDSTDGEHWNPHDSGKLNLHPLYSVFGASDGRRLWAVGEGGTILSSVDGEHWTAQILEPGEGRHWNVRKWGQADAYHSMFGGDSIRTKFELHSIFGKSDGTRLWAVGQGGMILESEDGEHWNARNSGTTNYLYSIFGTSDGKRLWAVGGGGTILESGDGEHWNACNSGTANLLYSIFGTSDGKRLWAVGTDGTTLESGDGEHWDARETGNAGVLHAVFGTRDGRRLLAVGDNGTMLLSETELAAPFVRGARVARTLTGPSLNVRVERTASSPLPSEMYVKVRNEYDANNGVDWRPQRPWPCAKDADDPDLWKCSIQTEELHLNVARKIHFLISVQRQGGADTYEFTTIYDPWAILREHPRRAVLASAILVLAVLPTLLLFVRPLWNVQIYRFLKLNRIEKIDIPGVGDFVQIVLRLVTVLPWFVRRSRTLDSWIEKHRAEIQLAWDAEARVPVPEPLDPAVSSSQPIFVPLPLRIGNPMSGSLVEQPDAAALRKLVKPPRATLQIVGPGGAGKTTLARQVGEWAYQYGPSTGLSDHPILPVWIDEELDPKENSLPAVVKGKLLAALPGEDIEDELFFALLRKQRLLVFMDRVSERSAATQRYIEKIYRSVQVGCLILTSRTPLAIDGVQSIFIYPQALNSATLLNFMTGLLGFLLADTADKGQMGLRPLSSIEEQLKLGGRLAALMRLQTGDDQRDVPLLPLPVRLFVEEAVRLVREAKGLDDLPISLPEVYFRHLRRVNPDDPSVQHFLDGDRMLKVAKLLAKVAIGRDFIPREFRKEEATAALKSVGEVVSVSCDPTVRLRMNGVLVEKSGGLGTQLRFALDQIAEFLAAAQYAEECAADAEKWKALLSQTESAHGFHMALVLTRQAYGRQRGWAMPDRT
jgi:photosystem II stability/assembly factor-like uncharacterized protein